MKKRIISLLLVLCTVMCATPYALGTASLTNFAPTRTYQGEFTDILPNEWYYDNVRGVYEYGIIDGKGSGIFDPSGRLTIAETIKLASSLHKAYYTGTMEFAAGAPWYTPYIGYAIDNGIIAGEYRNYDAAATRADFALIIAGAVPDEAITPINRIADGEIPDVYENYSYGKAVYALYRAGVLTGSDDEGTFYPGRTISRAEAAAIIMRILKADLRQSFTLATPLSAEQIYKLASPAVFYIEVFDGDDKVAKTGSGFFISGSGLAVTNYHVIVGAVSARVTMDSGEDIDVAGIYDYDRKNDLALIQIDKTGVESFPYLEIADPTRLLTGATVYTLGSPLGLNASFSRGIISQASREIDGVKYIQLDAPISSGSSGGALLDSYGSVVGVTSATATGAQNINLAMPINLVGELSSGTAVPLKSILIETAYYKGHVPAPDFGAYFGVSVFNTGPARGGTAYSYRLSDLNGDIDEIIETYTNLVEQNLFEYTGYYTSDGVDYKMYYNSQRGVLMAFGKDTVRSRECFTITLS